MIKALLIIRLKQIGRTLIEIGLFRLLFLIALTSFLGLALYIKTSDIETSRIISFGFLIISIVIQLKRKDKLFLKSHFPNYKTLMLSEYLILSIPLVTCLLIHKQWHALVPLLGLAAVVQFDFKAKHSTLNTKLQNIIPADSFEWKAGIRKQFFILIPIWIISIATSFFIGSVPIALFIIGTTTLSFHEKCEPYQMLMTYELDSRKLLTLKVKRQLQLFSIITVPLIALFVIFHIDYWYIPLAEYLIFCFLHIYVIMTKYAHYTPGNNSPSAQILIGIIGGLIPVFLPAVWVMTIWFYSKSIKNLNLYLDDYDK